jgi:hypothetical protein
MPSASNAKVEVELGQQLHAMAVMTDSGDHQYYTISGGTVWSARSGNTADIRPSGIVSGRTLLSAGTTNDTVRVAAFTAYSKGVLQTVTATSATISRPTTAGYYKINSITMASDGSIAVVAGTQATSAFSETRDANGGPPYIPINSVEIGQVRVSSSTAADIATTEIFQVVGTHTERYDAPVWSESNLGKGQAADVSAETNAHIKFAAALPLIHTGGIPKKVYMSYYSPIYSEQQKAFDFKPAENSHSVTSQQYYRGTVGSVSATLGQGGFTALLDDGVTDSLVAEKDAKLTVRFYPNINSSPYVLSQGLLGLTRTYPADGQIQASVTITAEELSAEFQS